MFLRLFLFARICGFEAVFAFWCLIGVLLYIFLLLRSGLKQVLQDFRCRFVCRSDCMDIRLCCGCCRRMAKSLGYCCHIDTVGNQQSSVCMTQGMDVSIRQVVFPNEFSDPGCQTVWMQWVSVPLGEYEIIIVPAVAKL